MRTRSTLAALGMIVSVGMIWGVSRAEAANPWGFGIHFGNARVHVGHAGGAYGHHYIRGHSIGRYGHGHARRGHYDWHDTTHYDWHPGHYQRHGNHLHYLPGHYDLHQSGHYDYHRGSHHRGHYRH